MVLPIKPYDFDGNTLRISVPNNFFIEWIEEHYNTLINKTISQVVGPDAKLVYIINEEEKEDIQLFDSPIVETKKLLQKPLNWNLKLILVHAIHLIIL